MAFPHYGCWSLSQLSVRGRNPPWTGHQSHSVKCAQCELVLLCGENRAPIDNLLFPGKCQSGSTALAVNTGLAQAWPSGHPNGASFWGFWQKQAHKWPAGGHLVELWLVVLLLGCCLAKAPSTSPGASWYVLDAPHIDHLTTESDIGEKLHYPSTFLVLLVASYGLGFCNLGKTAALL